MYYKAIITITYKVPYLHTQNKCDVCSELGRRDIYAYQGSELGGRPVSGDPVLICPARGLSHAFICADTPSDNKNMYDISTVI
jgi:hypothetical protein